MSHMPMRVQLPDHEADCRKERLLCASPAGPGYVATPIWDRQEITSTVAQYKEREYAASLQAFNKRIVEDVQKGHAPRDIARLSPDWTPVSTYADL